MKKIFLVLYLFLLLLLPNPCLAATHNAASCSNSDINSAISSSSSGDTVNVPAGNCTWNGTVTIPTDKTIALIGAGKTQTIISATSSLNFITSSSPNSRVSGFRFNPYNGSLSSEYILEVKNTGFRVDHNDFHAPAAGLGCEISASGTNMSGVRPTGVFDNNNFNECRIVVTAAGGFSTMNDAWYIDSVLGTATSVYIEDNTFLRTTGNWVDANYAGMYVARYNTVDYAIDIMAHSLQGAAERGTRSWEIYGNDIDNHYNDVGFIRGGTGVIFGNRVDFSSESYSNTADFLYDNVRSFQTGCCGGSAPDAGMCDGSSPWDGNTSGQNGWPCRDQIGRGKDSALFNTTTYAASTSQPAYSWSNRNISAWAAGGNSNIPIAIGNGTEAWIQANRDYYDYNASFNGTLGVGCGTLASRPATCTTGVGYWATNQSCTNLTGMVGVTPSTPLSGTLYKCTATNTWEPYYTPYAYPHPLRGESGSGSYMITIAKTGDGTGTVTEGENINCGETCAYDYYLYDGQEIEFTSTPATGSYVSGWSGCTQQADPTKCKLNVSADATVTTTFTNGRKATMGAGGGTITLGP